MNQILATESSQKKESKNKNKKIKNRSNSNGPQSDIVRKAAIVFSILLIIFGAVILTVKLVQLGKETSKNNKRPDLNKPQVSIEKVSENKANVNISYDEKITKLSWWWNDEKSKMQEKNYDVHMFTVDIPEEETSVLHLKVEAADGSYTEHEETFKRETIIIKVEQTGDKLQISAKSKKGIEKIVYYWNEEAPTTVPAADDDQEELQTEIPLKRGANILNIIATDNDGNTKERKEPLKGVKKPEIDVQMNLDQMLTIVTVTHDMGFKSITVEANGKPVVYDESYANYDPDRTKVVIKAKIKPGMNNKVDVIAYSNEEIDDNTTTSEEYHGEKYIENNSTTEEE